MPQTAFQANVFLTRSLGVGTYTGILKAAEGVAEGGVEGGFRRGVC